MNNGFIIQTHDLRKTYRVGKVDVPALRGVDLQVKPGEFLAIVGPSGSGKSTLFHIIGGLTPPTSGQVQVAGQNLASLTDAGRTSLRKRTVGFVFQKFNLLPNLTARDNIAVARYIGGNRTPPDAQFDEVLRVLGIDQRLDNKPNALSAAPACPSATFASFSRNSISCRISPRATTSPWLATSAAIAPRPMRNSTRCCACWASGGVR